MKRNFPLLNYSAKAANITIMNEIGLDPGIDHLTALSMFKKVRESGGKITDFISWCGGLPSPEASDNPLGYKFSWSPQGVLLATGNNATYLSKGQVIEIPGINLLSNAEQVSIMKGYSLEGYPNRDSLKYIDTYQLDRDSLKTMFRGTLRYSGFSQLMNSFKILGLLNRDSLPIQLESWV
jgi:alpha-aminoadipic semialdehyde synthase